MAQRGKLSVKSELFGKAFKNWVHHELCAWLEYRQRTEQITFWQLSSGIEVDFIVGHMKCAIEAKASSKVHKDHLKGLREIIEDYPEIQRRVVISLEPISRRTDDGIEILSVQDFCRNLWADELLSDSSSHK